jgi:NAD-dependent SIR2 family protein deacetylase
LLFWQEILLEKETINELKELFSKSNKIFFFTGAGISTNCGIPDFRGPNGLYTFVQKKYALPYAEAIFDIDYFHKNPEPFFDLSKEFFAKSVKPSPTHKFISWLEEKNKVSLVMTQNIDMLHRAAGSKKIIECHGTYASAHCTKCKKEYSFGEVEENLKNGSVPYCKCSGVIKPDVVFFGEQLSASFYNAYRNPPEIDLAVIMGTSLTVQPAAGFALSVLESSKSIIVNLTETEFDRLFDYKILSDLDEFTTELWKELKKEI